MEPFLFYLRSNPEVFTNKTVEIKSQKQNEENKPKSKYIKYYFF